MNADLKVIRELMVQQLKPLILRSARLSQLLEGQAEAAATEEERRYCRACLIENETHLRVLMGMLLQLSGNAASQVTVFVQGGDGNEESFEGLLA